MKGITLNIDLERLCREPGIMPVPIRLIWFGAEYTNETWLRSREKSAVGLAVFQSYLKRNSKM